MKFILPFIYSQGLGGKGGERVTDLFQVEYIGQLRKYSLDVLQASLGEKDGCWLFNLIRGIETTPVNSRNLYKSISASKNFPGKTSLDTNEKVQESVFRNQIFKFCVLNRLKLGVII